ncbi:hypothetical protein P8452_31108 [Trifolium repens]|nr:hypothetical protein P8452_31108 [Trifolium repens]
MFSFALIIFLSLFLVVIGITSKVPCKVDQDCPVLVGFEGSIPCKVDQDCPVIVGYARECTNDLCEYNRH